MTEDNLIKTVGSVLIGWQKNTITIGLYIKVHGSSIIESPTGFKLKKTISLSGIGDRTLFDNLSSLKATIFLKMKWKIFNFLFIMRKSCLSSPVGGQKAAIFILRSCSTCTIYKLKQNISFNLPQHFKARRMSYYPGAITRRNHLPQTAT